MKTKASKYPNFWKERQREYTALTAAQTVAAYFQVTEEPGFTEASSFAALFHQEL